MCMNPDGYLLNYTSNANDRGSYTYVGGNRIIVLL